MREISNFKREYEWLKWWQAGWGRDTEGATQAHHTLWASLKLPLAEISYSENDAVSHPAPLPGPKWKVTLGQSPHRADASFEKENWHPTNQLAAEVATPLSQSAVAKCRWRHLIGAAVCWQCFQFHFEIWNWNFVKTVLNNVIWL